MNRLAWLVLLLGQGGTAFALQTLDDETLSAETAQAGLSVVVSNSNYIGGSTAKYQYTMTDPTGQSAMLEAQAWQINGIGTGGAGIGSGGASTSGLFTDTTNFDVGENSAGTVPALEITSSWTRQRLTGSLDLNGTYNFGSFAFDTSGSFTMVNTNGFLSSSTTNESTNQLNLTLGTPQLGLTSPGVSGQLYYRQGAVGQPELVASNFYLEVGFTQGTGGIIGTCVHTANCGNFPSAGSFASGSTGRTGILISTPHLEFNTTFALGERLTPGTSSGGGTITPVGFTTSGGDTVSGLFTYGYGQAAALGNVQQPLGGFNNAELLISAGGSWATPSASGTYNPDNPSDASGSYTALARGQGINLAFHADYDSNFNWILGPASGSALVEFGGWTKISGATYGLNAPDITLDVFTANGTYAGPGGLCWGASVYGGSSACTSKTFTAFNSRVSNGTFVNVAPSGTTAAILVRDLSLQAYSTTVTFLQDLNGDGQFSGSSVINGITAPEVQTVNWALIYTLGTVDGNIFLYPKNAAGTGNGLTADVLLMAQSFGTTASNTLLGNTNFMIADSGSHFGGGSGQNLGIGLMQANLLIAASQLNMGLTSSGIEFQTKAARVEVKGMFAGGTVPDMTSCTSAPAAGTSCQISIATVDENFEFYNGGTNNALDITIAPKTTAGGYAYLSFDGTVVFGTLPGTTGFNSGSGTYISLGEPSSGAEKGANITLGNISGALSITNSRFFLIPASDTADTSDVTGSPDGQARLQIAENLTVTTPLTIGSVTLQAGGATLGTAENLGSIVIPSGTWYSSVELKRQY